MVRAEKKETGVCQLRRSKLVNVISIVNYIQETHRVFGPSKCPNPINLPLPKS